MPRRPGGGAPPTTRLGAAMRDARGATTQAAAAVASGIPQPTLARIERGTHEPSLDTAVALARWLGWSVEQVVEAARTPVSSVEVQ